MIEGADPDELKIISHDDFFEEIKETGQKENMLPEPDVKKDVPGLEEGADNYNAEQESEEFNDGENGESADNNTGNRKKQKVDFNIGEAVSPDFVVELLNVLMPVLISLTLSYWNIDCNKKDFSLSAAEKKVLAEPMGAVLASANIKEISPGWALALGLLTVYGSKVGEVVMEHNRNEKNKKEMRAEFEQWAKEEGYIKAPNGMKIETRGRKKKNAA